MIIVNKEKFMMKAIELSKKSIDKGGGPFGCVIVKKNKVIAEGYNQVTIKNDPTAHAEIVAIRKACKALDTFDLKGVEIFTSCEPCPMCLSAIYWAHINKIYYGNSRQDAALIDFDDELIYNELKLDIDQRKIQMSQINNKEALEVFKLWDKKLDKTKY
jgi:tRNA(Arg) A34 adenosine deaminase TadA